MQNYDEIRIERLKVFAHHGVLDEEKEEGQYFFLSLVLYVDSFAAEESDDLKNAVDYGEICCRAEEITRETRFNLIETLAAEIAESIMKENSQIKGISVEVNKPSAPVKAKFSNISVTTKRFRKKAYIAFGSNLGDRKKHIAKALKRLGSIRGVEITKVSNTIETPPYGGIEQPPFLNGCIEISTFLKPHKLLKVLKDIEKLEGRQKTVRWGPRTLDLDIIFYGDLILEDEALTIPHEDMANRLFVLEPLAEIAPKYRHPKTGKTVEELLTSANRQLAMEK